MNDKTLYKKLCFADRGAILKTLPLEKQLFIAQNWVFENSCRLCHTSIKEDDFALHVSYWKGMYFMVHSGCAKECKDKEDIECQTLDADCNDCGYFERGTRVGKNTFMGNCLKLKKAVKAYPVFSSGHDCFVHRIVKVEK